MIVWGVAKLVRQRVLVPSFIGSSPITPAFGKEVSEYL